MGNDVTAVSFGTHSRPDITCDQAPFSLCEGTSADIRGHESDAQLGLIAG